MDKFIFKMEVREVILPKLMNWLGGEWEEDWSDDDFKEKVYKLHFATFEEVSRKLHEITKGFHQYSADVTNDIYGNNNEFLEYYNGHGEWDKEINIETSRIYLTDDLLESIKKVIRY